MAIGKKGLEKYEKCVGAGASMLSTGRSYGHPIYMDNVGYALGSRQGKVPHSDLARHVGVAGSDILVFNTDGNGACVVAVNQDGDAKFTCGLSRELLSHELIEGSKFIWERKLNRRK